MVSNRVQKQQQTIQILPICQSWKKKQKKNYKAKKQKASFTFKTWGASSSISVSSPERRWPLQSSYYQLWLSLMNCGWRPGKYKRTGLSSAGVAERAAFHCCSASPLTLTDNICFHHLSLSLLNKKHTHTPKKKSGKKSMIDLEVW